MRIIPALDLKQGHVVRAVGGRRDEYRPIVSRLCPTSVPLEVARALRRHFGFHQLYVADLDAIAGALPAAAIYHDLCAESFRLWLDAGVRTPEAACRLAAASDVVVIASETADVGTLAAAIQTLGPDRIAFSLDLYEGALWRSAGQRDAYAVAEEAIQAGATRLIVLDIARVGAHEGPGTEALCKRLRAAFPGVQLIAGGGVRGRHDLRTLEQAGVDAALVASALHDGRLTESDVACFADGCHEKNADCPGLSSTSTSSRSG